MIHVQDGCKYAYVSVIYKILHNINSLYIFPMIEDQKQELPTGLQKQIKENKPRYTKLSQLALYSSLEPIDQMRVFTKSSQDVQRNVVFCFDGSKYDPEKKEDITLYIIRTLDQQIVKLKNKYSIAYLHESLSTYLYLRGILHLLPESHLARLQNIYIVRGGFFVKVVEKFSFGSINSFLLSKTHHLNTLEQIQENHKILMGGGLTKSKMGMLGKTPDGRQQAPQRVTHEADLSVNQIDRTKFYGKELRDYQMSSDNIPVIIQHLVVRLYSTTQFLHAEGIMRKSSDVEQLEILENEIMSNPDYKGFIEIFDNPYVLCGCLKKIFNNLYTPIFSYELYDLIISYRSDGHSENDIYFAKSCIDKMQKLNRRVLLYMMAFLKRGIVANQQINKMNAKNLAVVFGPCFFRPKEYRLEALIHSGRFSFIILLILDNFEEILGKEAFEYYNLLDSQKSKAKTNEN